MFLKLTASIAAILSTVSAHMAVTSPCPRYGSGSDCPAVPPGQSVDYNIKAPIGTHDGVEQPLCKHTTPYGQPVATYSAGATIPVSFTSDGAAHGGGHCQFALSYDGGNTFVVIQDELKYCFTGGPSTGNTPGVVNYNVKIPADAPAGDKVIFAWTWNNAIGNREFYMNCVDIAITGGGTSLSGPRMLTANYGPYSPYIPEFGGNYDTGLDLFQQRPTVTVTGNGSAAISVPASTGGSSGQNGGPKYTVSDNYGNGGLSSSNNQDSKAYYTTVNEETPIGRNASPAISASSINSSIQVQKPTPVVPPNSEQSYETGGSPSYSASNHDDNDGNSDGCTHGVMECSGSGFQVCVWGKWTKLDCPTGTTCKANSDGSSIICDFASQPVAAV